MLQPKEEEEPSGDKVLESDQEKTSHGLEAEREPSELKAVKAVEENGEQEAEPVRNGAESVSEGEGADGTAGCTESSGEGPLYQYKPGRSCSLCCSACPCQGCCHPECHPCACPVGLEGDLVCAVSALPRSATQQAPRDLPRGKSVLV